LPIAFALRSWQAANARRPGSGIEIDDVSFHQCVKLGKFDMDRTISFVPPDGEFQLMSYRITENVNLPFRVLPVVKELGRTRLEVNVKVKAMFTFKLFATNVVIKIPLPANTANANVSAASGKCKYEPAQGGIIWKLRRFPGDTEYFMSGTPRSSTRALPSAASTCHAPPRQPPYTDTRFDSLCATPRRGGDDGDDERRQGMEPPTHRDGFPGAYVRCQRASCALPEGLRKVQLPDDQVGPLHHKGGLISAPHLKLAPEASCA
jgi:hypothetical protein